jgi:hypothetical protein
MKQSILLCGNYSDAMSEVQCAETWANQVEKGFALRSSKSPCFGDGHL